VSIVEAVPPIFQGCGWRTAPGTVADSVAAGGVKHIVIGALAPFILSFDHLPARRTGLAAVTPLAGIVVGYINDIVIILYLPLRQNAPV
jgi:hypothetical protein